LIISWLVFCNRNNNWCYFLWCSYLLY